MMSVQIESILFQEEEVVKFGKEDIEDLDTFMEEISAGLNKRAGDAVKIDDGGEGVDPSPVKIGDGGEGVDPSLNERVGSSPNNLKKSGGVEGMFSDDDEWILETTTIKAGAPLTPVGECFSHPNQVSAPVQSILKKGKNKKMVFAKKSGVNEKKKIISACQRCIIIRTLLIQGVKKGSELPIQEDVLPFISELLSERKKCKICKKILTILSG